MTHQTATDHAYRGAQLISQLLKAGRIPDDEKSEACDIAIDLNLLAQYHAEQIPDDEPKPAKMK